MVGNKNGNHGSEWGFWKWVWELGIVGDYKEGWGRGGIFSTFAPNVKTSKKYPKDSKKKENTYFFSN